MDEAVFINNHSVYVFKFVLFVCLFLQVTPAHKQSLDGCLMLNGTFLKKSLQAALKRITPS